MEKKVKVELEDILTRSILHGERMVKLSQELIEKQELHEGDIEKLLILHKKKMIIEEEMRKLSDPDMAERGTLRKYDKKLTQIEFALQAVWGFPQDENYHKFWERPHCKCPQMDNDDRYPTGFYVINGECPLHGTENE